MVVCNPCLLMCSCPNVVFLDFSRCFLVDFLVRTGHIFRNPCLVSLVRLSVVELKSAAFKYWDSSVFEVCARILFIIFYDCCGPRGTSHIPVFWFRVPFIISSPFFWMDISCLSSVMVHPSSHITPNYINGAVCILRKIWIYLACFLRPDSWIFDMCVESVVLPSSILYFISFSIITGDIVWGGLYC